ncbi:putative polyprenyl synthase [Leishmania mexicana MHOM/GT/2001/U1103]|uniref:Polyprenyl synthase n=1 Tax=Leishmania mexicana (strain MHOM/GT/2001/U1103) TaxID=929439 RepID=E9ARX3_LEIMU|nr:putative polyprenyl synthase [Leishmania mexicana MHOM/GT/2001/U1103]CBZ25694.1 putative polyprenyl synthase [Leishmania mexicana MHOM/GT/2001/U1103]
MSDYWPQHFPPRGIVPDAEVYDQFISASTLQWWYANAHLTVKGEDKSSLAFFASFFRQAGDNCPTATTKYYDACVWALIDLENKKYYADSALDPESIEQLKLRLDPAVIGRNLEHVELALLELLNKGGLPRPDRLLKEKAVYTQQPFSITLDDSCMMRVAQEGPARRYTFSMTNAADEVYVEVCLETQQEPVLHGKDGLVNGMYYYYFPSMSVTGYVVLKGVKREVTGLGWYDRELEGSNCEVGRESKYNWSWLSLHASNMSQLSIFLVSGDTESEAKEKCLVETRADGSCHFHDDVIIETNKTWSSLVTFMQYPSELRLCSASMGLDVTIHTAFAAQEIGTVLVGGAGFYEGVVEGSGVCGGDAVTLRGFLEYKRSVAPYSNTLELLKCVGSYVHDALEEIYPLTASDSWVSENVLGRYAVNRGAPADKICETLFRPVRSIIDRGGKSWRSLIFVSCCNALSRQYFDCSRYIAVAELLHVGSLIIDDIQDNSVVRRGGKCVHVEYGVATAINAGSACYFMGPRAARIQDLPPEKASRIYKLYFDVLLAGHAGQGLDIYRLDYLMPKVVETGDTSTLVDALDAIHTYKTGAAVGALCSMACVLCETPTVLSEAMERFGLTLGLAFQIVDDALNIRGFEGDLKEEAEDIKDGKITYPIAIAMGRLKAADRQALWSILQKPTKEAADIHQAVELITKVDATSECFLIARHQLQEMWNFLDPLLEDSFPKLLMRTFCSFLVERTY